MAWIDERGIPFPRHRGEFCGNHWPDGEPLRLFGELPSETLRRHREYLDRMRFGRPRTCPAFPTQEEVDASGMVGLYLKQDLNRDIGRAIDTPTELMEPGMESAYNTNGPGRADDISDQITRKEIDHGDL